MLEATQEISSNHDSSSIAWFGGKILWNFSEHFAGKFPLWLAPVQVCVMPINQKQHDYADSVYKILKKNGLRVEIDLRNEKIGSKIRDHTLNKIPYMIVLGDEKFVMRKSLLELKRVKTWVI